MELTNRISLTWLLPNLHDFGYVALARFHTSTTKAHLTEVEAQRACTDAQRLLGSNKTGRCSPHPVFFHRISNFLLHLIEAEGARIVPAGNSSRTVRGSQTSNKQAAALLESVFLDDWHFIGGRDEATPAVYTLGTNWLCSQRKFATTEFT